MTTQKHDPTERPVPIESSYWVNPQLLASEYPGNLDDTIACTRLQYFLNVGITRFLDLTEAGEFSSYTRGAPVRPYAALLQQLAAQQGIDIAYTRSAIPDGAVPPVDQMIDILDTIDQAHAEGQTLTVHCLGGVGRTGTVVGCYLVRHGTHPDAALQLIRERVATTPKAIYRSPDTFEQVRMVLHWKPGQ